jgi:hypothetical protein
MSFIGKIISSLSIFNKPEAKSNAIPGGEDVRDTIIRQNESRGYIDRVPFGSENAGERLAPATFVGELRNAFRDWFKRKAHTRIPGEGQVLGPKPSREIQRRLDIANNDSIFAPLGEYDQNDLKKLPLEQLQDMIAWKHYDLVWKNRQSILRDEENVRSQMRQEAWASFGSPEFDIEDALQRANTWEHEEGMMVRDLQDINSEAGQFYRGFDSSIFNRLGKRQRD